jgi:hypothetical protein
LLELSQEHFETAVERALRHKIIPTSTDNRLRMSQYLLDYVASVPSRRVGVLQHDPTAPTTLCNEGRHPTECLSQQQSCLPSAALELVTLGLSGIQCQVIALYDSTTSTQSITISSRPPRPLGGCSCPRCTYDRDPQQYCEELIATSGGRQHRALEETHRLAHVLFQEQNYDQAQKLYRICHDSPNSTIHQKAEVWHAMGAVDLTRNRFVQAQRHWKEKSQYSEIHTGIALQLEKQAAYGYFRSLPIPSSTAGEHSTMFEYDTLSPKRLFLSPSTTIPKETCQKLIQWAEDYGTNEGGWTTSRHYAVPTNDVPIHKVPKLLEWFQHWMSTDCQALLREQFQTHRRFYVHDAFLVRYSAAATSRFLPLHYDESTHSMVLALNDDFEGGGTYFFNVDSTLSPLCGSLVTFRGDQMLHGGNVVTKGTRYIVAVFLYLDDDDDENTLTLRASKGKGPTRNTSPNKRPKTMDEGDKGGFSFAFF